MRRFMLQTQVSVDGYTGGPGGEMDWLAMEWSDDVGAALHLQPRR